VTEAAKIIKKELIDNLFKNVKDIDEFIEIWKRLHLTCIQVKQKVIYAYLCILLLHLFTVKTLKHKKSIIICFNEVNNLIKKIKVTISFKQDVWNDIVLITVLKDLLKKYNVWKNHLLN